MAVVPPHAVELLPGYTWNGWVETEIQFINPCLTMPWRPDEESRVIPFNPDTPPHTREEVVKQLRLAGWVVDFDGVSAGCVVYRPRPTFLRKLKELFK